MSMAHFKDPLVWLAGLLSAFLSGGAGAVTAGISAIAIAPDKFNLQDGLKHTLTLMGTNFLVAGLFGFFTRLQKSPLPEVVLDQTTTITRTTSTKVEQTPTENP